MSHILRFFFQGLLVLLPALLTAYLVWTIGAALNRILFSAIGEQAQALLGLDWPTWLTSTIGLLLALVLVTLTGMLASIYLGRFLLQRIDALLQRIPLIRLLYTSLSDLFRAVLGDNKSFNHPVLVQIGPDPALRVAGFVTRDDLSLLGLNDDVAVYLPQSYNFAGNLIIVPRDRVVPIAAPASVVTALIVSGGISTSSRGTAAAVSPGDPPQKD